MMTMHAPLCTCDQCVRGREQFQQMYQKMMNAQNPNYEQLARQLQNAGPYAGPYQWPNTNPNTTNPYPGPYINRKPRVEEVARPREVTKVLVPCFAVIGTDGLIRLRIHPGFKPLVNDITKSWYASTAPKIEVEIEYDESVDLDKMIVGKLDEVAP